MRILITGGAGFVGSHLADKYVADGHEVVVIDNFMNGDMKNIQQLMGKKNFKLVTGDIRDAKLMEELTKGADQVIHLAAQIHVDRSVKEPELTYDINVKGTLNVLEAARKFDTQKVLFASTSEVYGTAQYSPMDEKHPLNSPHPYGASKIAGDRMCNAFTQSYGMNIAIMRCFNGYGPRQKDTGYGGAIPLFANKVLNDQNPVIFGTGEQTRDYVYIKDTVAAYDTIWKYPKPLDGPVNFGTGKEVKIIDIANMIIKIYGKEGKLKPVHVERRAGEVDQLIADATKAHGLGWDAKVNFEEGLRDYLEWYKKYKGF